MPKAFVIAPFEPPYTSYWYEVYLPALRSTGLVAQRADSIFTAGNVVRQIFELIEEADLIVAELTLPNANVYYELGVAHAKRKPCILLTQNTDAIPFDLRNQRHIVYNPTLPSWDDKLREDVVNAVRDTLDKPETSTLPLPPTASSNGADLDVRARIDMLQASVDSMRHERATQSSSSAPSDTPLGTADELRQHAIQLLEDGWEPDAVVEQLRARGAPHVWAKATVRELKERT